MLQVEVNKKKIVFVWHLPYVIIKRLKAADKQTLSQLLEEFTIYRKNRLFLAKDDLVAMPDRQLIESELGNDYVYISILPMLFAEYVTHEAGQKDAVAIVMDKEGGLGIKIINGRMVDTVIVYNSNDLSDFSNCYVLFPNQQVNVKQCNIVKFSKFIEWLSRNYRLVKIYGFPSTRKEKMASILYTAGVITVAGAIALGSLLTLGTQIQQQLNTTKRSLNNAKQRLVTLQQNYNSLQQQAKKLKESKENKIITNLQFVLTPPKKQGDLLALIDQIANKHHAVLTEMKPVGNKLVLTFNINNDKDALQLMEDLKKNFNEAVWKTSFKQNGMTIYQFEVMPK